jgi:hypothetical protein
MQQRHIKMSAMSPWKRLYKLVIDERVERWDGREADPVPPSGGSSIRFKKRIHRLGNHCIAPRRVVAVIVEQPTWIVLLSQNGQ